MRHIISNEKGVLTLDFIFASMLVFGFSTIIFSFSLTLSVAEVVQYMTFASARNYSLAHLNEDEQRQRAIAKFDELSTNPIFTPLVNMGWYELDPVVVDDFNNEYNPSPDFEHFNGARVTFRAPVLFKRIPLIGATASDPDQFAANVQSFLSREPTFQECQTQIQARAQQFRNLNPVTVPYVFDPNAVVVVMDNGC